MKNTKLQVARAGAALALLTLLAGCGGSDGDGGNAEASSGAEGVPGSAAPIFLNFTEIVGSKCGALFPTGNGVEQIDGVDVTCIEVAMRMIIVAATSLGLSGYETTEIAADTRVICFDEFSVMGVVFGLRVQEFVHQFLRAFEAQISAADHEQRHRDGHDAERRCVVDQVGGTVGGAEGHGDGPEEDPDADDADQRADLGTDEQSLEDAAIGEPFVAAGGHGIGRCCDARISHRDEIPPESSERCSL